MWQALREELHRRGLEIVTVALDAAGAATAAPWIEKAKATHPSLIDQTHVIDALFGIVNVPSSVWIDEDGMIVRGPETAHPWRPAYKDRAVPDGATADQRERIETVRALNVENERYVGALRDWVANGRRSRYALSPSDVVERSRPRPDGAAAASAHFALGQAISALGDRDGAAAHFKEAQRLHPTNWTYRRDAWSLFGTGFEDAYGTSWMAEVKKEGVENYYPRLEMPD